MRKHEGERLFGKLIHIWDDNIKMDFKEFVWDDMDWGHLVQNGEKQWVLVKMVLALGYHTMHGMFLVALWMERKIQEKWSEDICFRVIVLMIVVDWMLLLSFSYWFV